MQQHATDLAARRARDGHRHTAGVAGGTPCITRCPARSPSHGACAAAHGVPALRQTSCRARSRRASAIAGMRGARSPHARDPGSPEAPAPRASGARSPPCGRALACRVTTAMRPSCATRMRNRTRLGSTAVRVMLMRTAHPLPCGRQIPRELAPSRSVRRPRRSLVRSVWWTCDSTLPCGGSSDAVPAAAITCAQARGPRHVKATAAPRPHWAIAGPGRQMESR